VPLKILFADDSMTAQNMGKKILTDAGYEVITVSNGAAAVKKIAEQKPDIIILDVYMPGYTGLEVCEKVRASMHTVRTPVLLTVGKMEAYKPEDAARVRADGVIVKPFEASDLLAVVKKLEQRVEKSAEKTILIGRPIAAETAEYEFEPELPGAQSTGRSISTQSMVDVPDDMVGTSAFSDLLGVDLNHMMEQAAMPAPVAAAPIVETAPAPQQAPPLEVPVTFEPEVQAQAVPAEDVQTTLVATPVVESVPDVIEVPAAETSSEAVAERSPNDTQPVPIYQEPEPAAHLEIEHIVEPTAAPAADVVIHKDPALEATAAEITKSISVEHVEPGFMPTSPGHTEIHAVAGSNPDLVTDAMALSSFTTRFGVENAEHVPVGFAAESPVDVSTPAVEVEDHTPGNVATHEADAGTVSAPAEDDFEARVAAVMASYELSVAKAMEAAPAEAPAAVEEPHAVAQASAEQPSSFEYRPPVSYSDPVQEPVTATSEPPTAQAETPGPVVEIPAQASSSKEAVAAEPESTQEAAKAAADSDSIAQAVHRVMERLKPEMISEIIRELNAKK
jgi:CheY-like chemotaxis protein